MVGSDSCLYSYILLTRFGNRSQTVGWNASDISRAAVYASSAMIHIVPQCTTRVHAFSMHTSMIQFQRDINEDTNF